MPISTLPAPVTTTLLNEPCRLRSTAVLPVEAVASLEDSPSVIPRRASSQLLRMATAKLKERFHAPHGHRLFRSNSSHIAGQQPINEEQRQKEKNFISCYECNNEALSPKEIAEAPRAKEVGVASKQLRIGDFDLIKTIGTGMPPLVPASILTLTPIDGSRRNNPGTFARVWLACLAGSPKEGQKVFALKILRKTDSKNALSYHSRWTLMYRHSHSLEASGAYQKRAKHIICCGWPSIYHDNDY